MTISFYVCAKSCVQEYEDVGNTGFVVALAVPLLFSVFVLAACITLTVLAIRLEKDYLERVEEELFQVSQLCLFVKPKCPPACKKFT